MVLCNICGAKNKNDALHCAQCGARLETKQCRQCGEILAKNVRFCNKCGYPTSGKPCPQCGKVVPDEASFCATCGYSFAEEKPAKKTAARKTASGGTTAQKKSATTAKSATGAKKTTTAAKSTATKSAAASKSTGTKSTAAKSAPAKRAATAKSAAAKAESASTVAEEEKTVTPAKKPAARKTAAKPKEETKAVTEEEKPAEKPAPIVAEEKPAEEPAPIVAEEKTQEQKADKPYITEEPEREKPQKASGLTVIRAIALPIMLLAMLITSFFGMFKAEVALVDGDFSVSGFEAVRGIFIMADAPTQEELTRDFAQFVVDGKYSGDTEEVMRAAVKDYGVLRSAISEESLTPDFVVQILVWGITTIGLWVVTLLFTVLSFIHALGVVTKKKYTAYKHETLPYSLVTALAFSFLMTGGALAGGAVALIVLGAVSLAATAVCKFAIEKQPKDGLVTNLRRGICGVLVILTAIFATTNLVSVTYKDTDVKTAIPAEELYGGMSNVLEDAEKELGAILPDLLPEGEETAIRATDLDAFVRAALASDALEEDKKMILRVALSPVVLAYAEEAVDEFTTPVKAASWLLFIANIFFAAMVTMVLVRLLQGATNSGYAEKSLLWSGLTALGAAAVFFTALPFTVMGNSIAGDLSLGVKFGFSGLLIAAFVLGVVQFGIALALRKREKKTETHWLTEPPADWKK